MKNLVLKINSQEEADFCGQILKKIGFDFLHNLYYDFKVCRDYLFLGNSLYFFSFKDVVDDGVKQNYTILVNSWREFIINYLGNFYYLCQNKEEKEKLIDIICKNGLNEKNNFMSPIDMDSRYFAEVLSNLIFTRSKPKNKQEIGLDNLLILINSVRQFEELSHPKNNETMKKLDPNKKYYVKINDKYELAAAKSYLETFLEDNGLDIEFCKNMFRQKELTYSFLGFDSNPYIIHGYVSAQSKKCVSIQQFANWVKEKKLNTNKTFTFSNGMVAKLNNNSDAIIIEGKEHSIEFFEKFVNTFFLFDMLVTLDGKTYVNDDFEKFLNWLNEIKK